MMFTHKPTVEYIFNKKKWHHPRDKEHLNTSTSAGTLKEQKLMDEK